MNAKMKWGFFWVLAFLLAMAAETLAKGGGGGRGGGGTGRGSRSLGRAGQFLSNSPGEIKIPRSTVRFAPRLDYYGVATDSDGRILPSASAREEFLKSRGLQSVPEGHVIEHKIPLYAGGRDEPSNMQLATRDEHRAKTRVDYQLFGR
jgi:hypothetical protein